MLSVPDPFNGYHEMMNNSVATCQESIGILEPKGKTDFLKFWSLG